MPTHKDAKAMARSLRDALAARNVSFSHSECLEVVARQFGFADWNTLSARLPAEEGRLARSQGLDTAPPTAVSASTPSPVTERVPVIALRDVVSCSFCGKSQHEVRSLIEGRCSRPPLAPESCVFICDECVTFCAQINADTVGNALAPQERDDSTGGQTQGQTR